MHFRFARQHCLGLALALTLTLAGLLPMFALGAQAAAQASAQAQATRAEQRALTQYRLDTWQTEQGLPQNAVSALTQTRDGYLWVGTLGGLARFDGVRFTYFNTEEFPDIAAQPVLGLMQDAQGSLWIGHNKGATIYRDGVFRRVLSAPEKSDQRVWNFAQGPDGVVWAATNHGLARWDKGVVDYLDTRHGLPTERLRALAFDRDGVLWIATTGGGLVSYAQGKFTVFNTDNGFPHVQVRAVLADPAGGVWAATAGGGLARVNQGRITVYSVADGLPTDQLTTLARDIHGQLWIGTWGSGIVRMVGQRFTSLSSANGLVGDHIWSLQTDSQGEIWLGTWINGLVRMRERNFEWVGMPEGLSSDNVRSVLHTRAGVTWVATAGGGLNRIEGAATRHYGKQDGLPSEEISSLLEARDGALWIGTYTGGVARLEAGRSGGFTVFGTASGLPSAEVRVLFEDRAGTLWAGTQSGLARFDGAGFVAVRAAGAPTGSVGAIAQDRAGTLWFGTGGDGLVRYAAGKFATLTMADGMLSNWIMALHADAAGVLWAGTNGDGLNRVEGGRVTSIRPADGLWDGACLSILEDARGKLWITTNRGFFSVARSELNDFAAGKVARITSLAFGPGDAMRSSTFAGGLQPASAQDRAGRLLLPSTKGLVIVDPLNLPGASAPPQARLERVLVNGAERPWAEALRLPPGPATVAIHYSAATLLHAERVRFRYRMAGLTAAWIDSGVNREVSFPALQHGSYQFSIATSLDGKTWSEPGPPLQIVVAPFYYQTTWFAVLLGCAVLAAMLLLFRLRLHHLRVLHKEMEQQVAQKTEALRLANEHLSRLSFIDALTGLANRRRFDEDLRDEWQRACRAGTPLALIIADIDYFKRYNDTVGHPEGDRCLAQVASVFAGHARRAADLAARYGGEEFVLLLPDVELAAALQLAEEVRAGCEALAIAHPDSGVGGWVTLSLGVAVRTPAVGDDMLALVEEADAALYRAKHEGRNRVACL